MSRDMESGQFAPNGLFRHGFRTGSERQQIGHPHRQSPIASQQGEVS